MSEESIIGYFGKIPSKGDFITNSLSMEFTEPWDAWLREVLAYSKSSLGENWMELYLTAPIYHFSLSSGICGNSTWLGAFMPSVDSVGRHFPMTICKSFPAYANPIDLLESEKDWLAKAEELLLSCLREDFSTSDFDIELSKLKENDFGDTTITLKKSRIHQYEDKSWAFPVHEDESLSVVFPELLNSMLCTFYTTYSVWRANGSDNLSSSLVFSEGLPPSKSCVAFLDGKFGEWGWTDEQIIR